MVGNDIMWQKMIWDINGYVAEKIRQVTSGPFEGSCDKHASAHVDRIKNNHVHMTNLYLQTYTWDTHTHTHGYVCSFVDAFIERKTGTFATCRVIFQSPGSDAGLEVSPLETFASLILRNCICQWEAGPMLMQPGFRKPGLEKGRMCLAGLGLWILSFNEYYISSVWFNVFGRIRHRPCSISKISISKGDRVQLLRLLHACFCWRLVYRTCVFVFFFGRWGGVGWGGVGWDNNVQWH